MAAVEVAVVAAVEVEAAEAAPYRDETPLIPRTSPWTAAEALLAPTEAAGASRPEPDGCRPRPAPSHPHRWTKTTRCPSYRGHPGRLDRLEEALREYNPMAPLCSQASLTSYSSSSIRWV